MKKKLLISACLLGTYCRYNGETVTDPACAKLLDRYDLIPICPEILGGLPTPREPSERKDGRVVTPSGRDVTENYRRGAEETVRLAKMLGCTAAVLKERSPSCGSGVIYDGSFSHVRIPGDGVTAEMLKAAGIRVIGESEVEWELL